MNNRLFIITHSNQIKRDDLIKLLSKSIHTWMAHSPNALVVITSKAYSSRMIHDIIVKSAHKDARYTVAELDVKGGKAHGIWPQNHIDILVKFNLM